MFKEGDLIIEASAGTGKTHQLTSRIINLLARGESIENILATTFTRKAAGEIRARVFYRLAHAASNEENSKLLLDEIGVSDCDFKELLHSLTQNQHRINISTIDGIFVRIAKLFSAELGLPFHWDIADASTISQLRIEAVAKTIKHIQSTKLDSERYVFLHMLNSGKASRSIQSRLEQLTEKLDRFYYDTKNAKWSLGNSLGELSQTALSHSIEELENLEVPTNKDGKTKNARWAGALTKCKKLLAEQEWESFLEQTLVHKIINQETTFSSKEIPEPFIKAITPLAQHAQFSVLEIYRARTLATKQLLELFNSSLENERTKNGWLRFSDVTHLLEEQTASFLGPELYFRLDAKIKHLLLDEFQDTSISQWNILYPIIEEIVSQTSDERSFLCVGDAKQAIYGWRGGVSTIFKHLRECFPHVEVAPLHESRRLRPAIIELINKVFGSIESNQALTPYSNAQENWKSIYAPHTAFNKGVEGYCHIAYSEESEEKDIFAQTAELVISLNNQFPELEIGVLTRSSDAVRKICDSIRFYNPSLKPSQEVGAQLYRSEAVRIICSILRLIEHPGDTLSAFHINNSCLQSESGLNHKDLNFQLSKFGFYKLVQHWSSKLKKFSSIQDTIRLDKLCELAFSFENKSYFRVTDFIEEIKNTKIVNLLNSKVRVMNIHQCKGLEFDLVVLGELDKGFFNTNDEILTSRSNPLSKAELATCYPKKILRESNSELEVMYQDTKEKTVTEELSILYVALTRAKYGIYGLVNKKASDFPCTHAGILAAGFADTITSESSSKVLEIGNQSSLETLKNENSRKTDNPFAFNLKKLKL